MLPYKVTEDDFVYDFEFVKRIKKQMNTFPSKKKTA